MATMNISLPLRLKAFVEQQVATGRYANVSDYVRDLVRRDEQKAEAVAEFQRLVDEARASGISERSWESLMEEARARAGSGRKAG